MPTIFEAIIRGEQPAEFVWEDHTVVAFLDIHPHSPGHTLVIPRRAEDRWTDLDGDLTQHLFWVAQQIGRAQIVGFGCSRAGLAIAGFHVPHVHLHFFPATTMKDLDLRSLPPEASTHSLARVGSCCDFLPFLREDLAPLRLR